MLKSRKVFLLLFPLLFGGFIFGVVKLFQLRFDHGDVYPPSSSLRADPLGTKIFFESLRHLDSVTVARLYEPLHKIESGQGKTLFLLGTDIWALNWVPRQEAKEIEKFLFEGGRIVISFPPVAGKTFATRSKEKRQKEEAEEKTKKQKTKKYPLEEESAPIVSLLEKWQFKLDFEILDTDEDGIAKPVWATRAAGLNSLPEKLPWHTALFFDEPTNSWKTIYSHATNAVILERAFGKGSVVLSSDSYLFSNEAMRKAREPELLAWFVGQNQTVFFDETHLGVNADPGIAALARKYRLHGLVAGLLLLAGLFVWKNSASFVPPHDDDPFEGRNAVVSGKESAAGFVNLLRRSISPAEIISTCFAEWKKSPAHRRQKASKKMIQLESLLRDEGSRPPRERNPVQSFRAISTLLTDKK